MFTVSPYTGTPNLRASHAPVVDNGVMYVIGGDSSGTIQADVKTFNIATTTWSTVTTSGTFTGRYGHSATLYNDGIYVIGGRTFTSNVGLPDVLLFTISTSTWSTITTNGATFPGRCYHTATLYNDEIYVIAGQNDDSGYQKNDVFKFSISTSTWTSITYTGTFDKIVGHTATLYNDEIYVIGGNKYGGGFLNYVRKFTIATNVWTTITYSGTFNARYLHTATLYNDVIYVIAGLYANTNFNDMYMYDITTSSWTTIVYTGSFTYRGYHTAVYYNDNIYIHGGCYTSASYYYFSDVVVVSNLQSVGNY
jgi:N-acetylneuraminic acid mutarotase